MTKSEIFGIIDRHISAPRPCYGPGGAEYKMLPLAELPAALAAGWFLVSDVCVWETHAQVYRKKGVEIAFK